MANDGKTDLLRLLDPVLGPGTKGYPLQQPALPASEIGAQGWSVAAGDLPLPLAVIRRSALEHNLGWMQRFAAERRLALAPHGKTTMSPQLFGRQLRAGAWGMTVASVTQAMVAAAAGASRILIANQILDRAELAALAALRSSGGGLRVLFLLDSAAQLAAIEAAIEAAVEATAGPAEPAFEVLLEVGVEGGRTGCRGEAQALALARMARASAAVRLVGIECFEGLRIGADEADDAAQVAAFMELLRAVADGCAGEGLFETDEVLLSAGGSAVFDLVATALQTPLAQPMRGLLRSGCYLTHDQGHYQRLVARVDRRLGCGDGLRGALEVWARVQSCPEPGLAIVAVGKRDASYDMGLPQPLGWCAGTRRLPQAAPAGWRIDALNDQHAYLRHEPGRGPAVGDRLVLGISHPCTTFDKWRWMPVVDDDYLVVDAITTCF